MKSILSTDLRRFYAGVGLRHFSLALISLFVPAYLYLELNFSIQQILQYMFLLLGLAAILNLIAGKFVSKYGARNSMLLSVPFSLIAYYFLPTASNPLHLFLLAFFLAGFEALYYPSFHLYLARSSEGKKVGEATGKTWSSFYIATRIAPLAGGIILQYFEYYLLYVLIVAFQLASVFSLPETNRKEPLIPYSNVYRQLSFKEQLAWLSQGLSIFTHNLIWPLFAFLILKTYVFLGALKFAAGMAVSILSWWWGKLTDKVERKILLRVSWAIGSLSWFFRSTVIDPIGVFIGDLFGDATFISMETPIMYKVYTDGCRRNDLLSRIILREVIIRISMLPLLISAWFFPFNFAFFAMGIFYAALLLFYRRK